MRVDLEKSKDSKFCLKLVAENGQDRLTLAEWVKQQRVKSNEPVNGWWSGRAVGETAFTAITDPIMRPDGFHVDTARTPVGPDTVFIGDT